MDADAVRRRVVEHTEAVGRADVVHVRGLYAADAHLHDPAGSPPVVGREAIAAHFSRWLTVPRRITTRLVVVTGPGNSRAAVSFTATPDTGRPVDIIDVLTFDEHLLIVEMSMFATPRTEDDQERRGVP